MVRTDCLHKYISLIDHGNESTYNEMPMSCTVYLIDSVSHKDKLR